MLPLLPATGYAPRVMILGGDHVATATTEIIDLSVPNPAWRMLLPMSVGRARMNAVILPTGKLLALGGSAIDEDPITASLAPALFDPTLATLSSSAISVYPLSYLSYSLLLPYCTLALFSSHTVNVSQAHHL
mgnify:CR=1 FL=1